MLIIERVCICMVLKEIRSDYHYINVRYLEFISKVKRNKLRGQ